MVQLFCIFFSYVNITKLLKFKTAILKLPTPQKLIRSLADVEEHIWQIKRRSNGNYFLKRANEHFFVSGHSNQRVDNQNVTKRVPQWYVMAM